MAFLKAPCPHPGCGAEPVRLRVIRNYQPHIRRKYLVSCCMCLECGMPVSVVLRPRNEFSAKPALLLSDEAYANHDLLEVMAWCIVEIVPSRTERNVPRHTPEEIARIQRQAGAALARKQLETAGFLFRAVLDRALDVLDGGAAGSSRERINGLVEAGRLPADLRVWAGELPEIAAAGAAPSREDIAALDEFIAAFLLAAFTVPRMFELRTSGAADGERLAS